MVIPTVSAPDTLSSNWPQTGDSLRNTQQQDIGLGMYFPNQLETDGSKRYK
ncbi:MAG: hypothetical protein IPM96_15800 [Ignavibacteria bacterium]|nr:hypothetical protein [Ignavibacteria bacterium]